jgi:RNA polymerase sigma-70 factor (ECF subfamily)
MAARRVTHELRIDFEEAIRKLPPGARDVFVLHDVEGYTHEEIGAMLEVTAGTSKSQLHRARMALRQHLDAREA